MIKITVCIGSSCHLKGSRQIVEQFQYLIKNNNLSEDIELAGAFCMGKCASSGVSVTVNDEYFTVKPEEVNSFFKEKVLTKLVK